MTFFKVFRCLLMWNIILKLQTLKNLLLGKELSLPNRMKLENAIPAENVSAVVQREVENMF